MGVDEGPRGGEHAPLGPGWQASLFGGADEEIGFDAAFSGAERRELGDGAWLDVVPRWVGGADALFEQVLESVPPRPVLAR